MLDARGNLEQHLGEIDMAIESLLALWARLRPDQRESLRWRLEEFERERISVAFEGMVCPAASHSVGLQRLAEEGV